MKMTLTELISNLSGLFSPMIDGKDFKHYPCLSPGMPTD